MSDYIRRNAFTTKKNKRRLRGSECNNSKVNLTVGVLIRFVGGKKHHLALTHNRLLTNTAASNIKQTKVFPASENSLSSQKSNPGHINSKKVTLENITRWQKYTRICNSLKTWVNRFRMRINILGHKSN